MGKRRTASFGAYPIIGLADARKRRDALKRQLADGTDPASAKRAEAAAARAIAGNTFQVIADELVARQRREGRADRTLAKNEWLLDMASPALGRRPISEITAADVLEVLRGVEKRGRHETARRLRATTGSVFRYAIATARATGDATLALRGALTSPTVEPRAAVTDPEELGALLRAIDGYDGQPSTHAALELMAVLFPRPGELRAAEWSEFDIERIRHREGGLDDPGRARQDAPATPLAATAPGGRDPEMVA
jgi:integrase